MFLKQLQGVLNPNNPNITAKDIGALQLLFMFGAWFTDLVLAFRLLVIYPPRRTAKWKLAAVFAFPVLGKAVRVACAVAWYLRFRQQTQHINPAVASQIPGYRGSTFAVMEWFFHISEDL